MRGQVSRGLVAAIGAVVQLLAVGLGRAQQVQYADHHYTKSTLFLGEGGRVEFNPSPDIIHDQKTIYGSWVTSTWLMEELVERLVRWNLHPADLVTHRFSLDRVEQAYTLMASGKCGKVAVCFDEEL